MVHSFILLILFVCFQVCVCENGIPKTHENGCREHGANICHECTGAFHIEGDNCVQNVCTCDNGIASSGAGCAVHDSEHCESCDAYSTMRKDGEYYCRWIINIDNNLLAEVGLASSPSDCIGQVLAARQVEDHACFGADLATLQYAAWKPDTSGKCFCEMETTRENRLDKLEDPRICILDEHMSAHACERNVVQCPASDEICDCTNMCSEMYLPGSACNCDQGRACCRGGSRDTFTEVCTDVHHPIEYDYGCPLFETGERSCGENWGIPDDREVLEDEGGFDSHKDCCICGGGDKCMIPAVLPPFFYNEDVLFPSGYEGEGEYSHTISMIECPPPTCYCDNGIQAVGPACPRPEQRCMACNVGFHIVDDEGTRPGVCEQNICTCESGTPVNGTDCVVHEQNNCGVCNLGYHLDNVTVFKPKPVKPKRLAENRTSSMWDGFLSVFSSNQDVKHYDNSTLSRALQEEQKPFSCQPNRCVCENGEPAEDEGCFAHRGNICKSCRRKDFWFFFVFIGEIWTSCLFFFFQATLGFM